MATIKSMLRYLLLVIASLLFASNLCATYHKSHYGLVTVYYTQESPATINKVIEQLNANIDTFQRKIGLYPDLQFNIVFAESQKSYYAMTNNMSPIFGNSDAFYDPNKKTMFFKPVRKYLLIGKSLNNTLLHEYIHLFVNNYVPDAPLWFHEGMAEYFTSGITFENEIAFSKNFLAGNTLKLTEMRTDYPKNRIQWDVFYLKSTLAIQYLLKEKNAAFMRFWDYTKQGYPFDDAFLSAFHYSDVGFSTDFEIYLQSQTIKSFFMGGFGLLWSLMPIILILSWIKKQLFNKNTTTLVTTFPNEEEDDLEYVGGDPPPELESSDDSSTLPKNS